MHLVSKNQVSGMFENFLKIIIMSWQKCVSKLPNIKFFTAYLLQTEVIYIKASIKYWSNVKQGFDTKQA